MHHHQLPYKTDKANYQVYCIRRMCARVHCFRMYCQSLLFVADYNYGHARVALQSKLG